MTDAAGDNPLLDPSGPNRYDAVRPEHVVPAIRRHLAHAEEVLERAVALSGAPTWDGALGPLERAEEALGRAWSVASHMVEALGRADFREPFREAQELVVRHHARRTQDARLFRVVRAVAEDPAAAGLDSVRAKIVADRIRDFRLAGVHLPDAEKERCAALHAEIAALGAKFADHVTDDATRFRLVVGRREQVESLPPPLAAAARARALADDPAAPDDRWSFSLDQATVVAFTSSQRDRPLREAMHRAWVTRASAPPFDNAPVGRRILTLRRELAGRLGFATFADLSLATKMARSPAEVRGFLLDLVDRALPRARTETAELADLARREDGVDEIGRHDLAHYRERLRARVHGFSKEDLRPYFPLPGVLRGLAEVVRRLFGVSLRDRTDEGRLPTWHPDVRVLEIGEGGAVLGHVLFDPYARPGKRSGAWVSRSVACARHEDGSVQRPVARLVCNFPPPAGETPSLLAHDEVRTLFHEFGHALHNVLTVVEEPAASGTHGVPRDGVEFPSQFLENWIWRPESLAVIGAHHETGAPIPAETIARLQASRTFLAASDLVRQAELALFDLEIHTEFDPERDDVHAVAENVRRRVAVVPAAEWDRFENSFLHVFQAGYAAGYYGYKWAEVLAADAFGRFEEEGTFSARAGRDFRDHVLANGGGADFLDLFVRFRGRPPDSAALLRQVGIA